MADLLNLVLLYGGKSGEHEISQISAASVLAHLDKQKYRIFPIGMGKDGCYYLNDYDELITHGKVLPIKTSKFRQLDSLLINDKFVLNADLVFPMVHGPLYEDGCLQGVLELADVAYVGCNVLASAITMDKDIARRILIEDGIKFARYKTLLWHEKDENLRAFCEKVVSEFGWPLFVKPNVLGSSVGVHKVSNREDLLLAIADARRYDDSVLIEEAIVGREIELAVLENDNPTLPPKISVPGEIKVNHKDGYYSYTAKYTESEETDLLIPALMSQELQVELQNLAAKIFISLKCTGLARIDFFVNDVTNEIYFNEVNTLPGFTSISMYPALWQYSGLAYKDLLDNLVSLALNHKKRRRNLVTDYK